MSRLSVWYRRPDEDFLAKDLVWLQERLNLVNRADYQETVRLVTSVTLGVARGRMILAGKTPPPLPEYEELSEDAVPVWSPDKWWEQKSVADQEN